MPDEAIKKRMARAKKRADFYRNRLIAGFRDLNYYIQEVNCLAFDFIAARRLEWRLIIFEVAENFLGLQDRIHALEKITPLIDEHEIELTTKELWIPRLEDRHFSWLSYQYQHGIWISGEGIILKVENLPFILTPAETITVKDNEFGYIYFILNKSTMCVKIGVTKNIRRRLSELRADSGADLELITTIRTKNIYEKESMLHGHFLKHRVQGEWFQCCGEILGFIDLLKEKQENGRSKDKATSL